MGLLDDGRAEIHEAVGRRAARAALQASLTSPRSGPLRPAWADEALNVFRRVSLRSQRIQTGWDDRIEAAGVFRRRFAVIRSPRYYGEQLYLIRGQNRRRNGGSTGAIYAMDRRGYLHMVNLAYRFRFGLEQLGAEYRRAPGSPEIAEVKLEGLPDSCWFGTAEPSIGDPDQVQTGVTQAFAVATAALLDGRRLPSDSGLVDILTLLD